MNEFDIAYGLRRMWCSDCRKRTTHEFDDTPVNKWQPEKMPPGWWCTDCGKLNEKKK